MKKLFLIRHAQAEKFSESSKDIDRKLTSEGMKIASLLGKYLKDEGIKPDVIICSTAQRAQLTAELIASQVEYELDDIQCVDDLYEASVREFVGFLNQLGNVHKVVFIIGHNPAVTYAADYLCDGEVSGMSPGAVVQINFDTESWSGLSKGLGEYINYYDILSGS